MLQHIMACAAFASLDFFPNDSAQLAQTLPEQSDFEPVVFPSRCLFPDQSVMSPVALTCRSDGLGPSSIVNRKAPHYGPFMPMGSIYGS